MVQYENMVINGINFTKAYSDAGKYITRDNCQYQQAYDLSQLNYTYQETDIPISKDNTTPEEILNILLGGEET